MYNNIKFAKKQNVVINPPHACAARVTVVVLCEESATTMKSRTLVIEIS